MQKYQDSEPDLYLVNMPTRKDTKPTFEREILNSILSETPPTLLYHYTDQNGLLGIVKSKEVWATHHQCLNDIQEYLHAKGLIRTEINKRCGAANSDSRLLLDAMRSTLDGPGNEDVNLYVASFSADGDSLSQWRAYGGQTAGFALGFWADRIVLPDDFSVAPCIYKPEKQCEVVEAIVAEVLESRLAQMPTVGSANAELAAKVDLLGKLHRFALIFKDEKFQEEKEWRIISRVLMDFKPAFPVEEENKLDFRQGKSMLIPYRRVPLKDDRNSFPLHEVVVGPNPNPEQSIRSVLSLLNSQGLVAANIRPSSIPYRNW
jgi:Protein of unknown function (DUF2971)